MRAVVGLGNPGPSYARTRHNVGFLVAERFVARRGGTWQADHPAYWSAATRWAEAPVMVVKPMTWMNESGQAVADVVARFGSAGDDLVVVHDDLDLSSGTVRVKRGGGHGGHNGLRSVLAHCPTVGDFVRVRLGVGREDRTKDAADWVLEPLAGEALAATEELVERATDAVEAVFQAGPQWAMNCFNRRTSKAEGADESAAGRSADS